MTSRFALISVFNKNNLIPLVDTLLDQGYDLISTGGTFRLISNHLASSPERLNRLTQIDDVTGFPEILNGRVKTLHPKVHGAILARRDSPEHLRELQQHQINPIDVVVCNLYDFKSAIESDPNNLQNSLEMIDIGGVTLLRAGAKNFQHVTVLSDPEDYQMITRQTPLTTQERLLLAQKAFKHTATYDTMISEYLLQQQTEITRTFYPQFPMKYGCNPSQKNAYLYLNQNLPSPLKVLNGQPGYINLLDALGSWQLVSELHRLFQVPAVASFKHTSPAGVAIYTEDDSCLFLEKFLPNHRATQLSQTFARARYCDPKSSFGDFIALSDRCDLETAKLIKGEVSDGIIAPGYTDDALSILKAKKSGKYLILEMNPSYQPDPLIPEVREMFGFVLTQDRNTSIVTKDDLNFVTNQETISPNQINDLLLANLTLKYSQSNNIVFALNGQAIGIASGQQSRIDAVKLAGTKAITWAERNHPNVIEMLNHFKPGLSRNAKINAMISYVEGTYTQNFDQWLTNFEPSERFHHLAHTKSQLDTSNDLGFSLASDAFFPFRDNIDLAHQFGVTAIVQPGGSIADQGVIDACNQHGIQMAMTGKRMFTH